MAPSKKMGPKTAKIRATLAIPTYNRGSILIGTLKRVMALRPRPFEIILVDQTRLYSPEVKAFLADKARSGEIRWIRQSPPNLPLARGRAVKEARGDVIIFLDDDVVPPKDLVAKHLRNYRDPTISGVASRVAEQDTSLYPNRKHPQGWPRLLDPLFFSLRGKERIEGIATFWGSNFSVRTTSVRGIGEFDGRYFGTAKGEDSDIALRMWKKGYRIVFDPRIIVENKAEMMGGARLSRVWNPFTEWLVSYSSNYFCFRHYFPSSFFWYMSLGNLRRAVFREDNLRIFWRLPWAFLAFGYSWIYAACLYRFWVPRKTDDKVGMDELSRYSARLIRGKVRGLVLSFIGSGGPVG